MQVHNIPGSNLRKKLFFLCVVTFLPYLSFSQIRGTIKDTSGNNLSNVICILTNVVNPRSEFKKTSDQNGDFAFTNVVKGIYSLKLSLIGFKTEKIDSLIVNSIQVPINLDVIILHEERRQLNEVTVQYKQPALQQKMDKTIVNVGETISANGGSVLDVIERAPGIAVDRQNNNISMRGKEGVQIMINGKPTYLPVSEVVQMLKGIGTGVVSKVELISNPSSDLDASGNAGVINIILKKGSSLGKSFSYDLNGGYGRRGKLGGDINYTNQFGRLNIAASYSIIYNQMKEQWQVNRINTFHDTLFTNNTITNRSPTNLTNSGNIRLDLPVNDRLSLGANVQFYTKRWNMNADNNTISNNNQSIQQTDNERDRWLNILSGVDAKYLFNPHNYVTANADYLSYVNNNKHLYDNDYFSSGNLLRTETIATDKHTPIAIKVFKVDYNYTSNSKFTFKMGVKAALSSFTNDVNETNLNNLNNALIVNLDGKDFLNENIFAVYSTLQYAISKKVNLDGGLRYEYTSSNLTDQNNNSLFDRKYGNLFPSITAKYEINADNTLQLGYNKRIFRPSFTDIAPFIVFLDPYTYVTGNEELKPTKTDNYSLSYKLLDYFFSLEFSNNTNSISTFQPVLNTEINTLLLTPKNIDNLKVISFTANAPFELNAWWKLLASGTYFYQKIRTSYAYNEQLNLSKNAVRLNITNNFTLPEGISIELSGYIQSPFIVGITTRSIPREVNLGLLKKIDERSNISLVINDVFKTNIWTETNKLSVADFELHRMNNFETQIVRVAYTYKFGVSKQKQREKIDEEKRVN